MDCPIITSRLDNDFYAFTMGQLIWCHTRGVNVKYKFFNRGVLLNPSLLAKLQEQIDHCLSLKFSIEEIDYLESLNIFKSGYLAWLALDSRMPNVHCWVQDDSIQIEYEGPWASSVFWETSLLAIITELYMESQGYDINEGISRFHDKSYLLGENPGVRIMEFGSRRRASRSMQQYILMALMKYNAKNLLGTSNVMFAKELGLKPMGTMAHQLFMVMTALAKSNPGRLNWLFDGTGTILDLFENLYGDHPEMLIYLPDTYGTLTGLACMSKERASSWAGVRQDSGSPEQVIDNILYWYAKQGIDPRTKLIAPSDGLTVPNAIHLYSKYGEMCNMAFGIGTSLTNDVNTPAPNFVIKPAFANGYPCVKLSDANGKITGDSGLVAEYQAAALDVQRGSL